MPRFKLFAGTAIGAIFLAGGALAADMPVYYEPEPIPAFGGWYLRGDVGVSHQRVGDFFNTGWAGLGVPVYLMEDDFEASWFAGIGAGYQFNEWFRVDVTGEYRGPSSFHGLDLIDDGGPTINDYRTKKSEWTFLANAYFDLGTYYERLTPFVGAGIGASYNRIHDLTDTNLINIAGGAFCSVNGCADANGKWSLAWALHAGLAYTISPNMIFEVAYRYLHLGDAESGDLVSNVGVNNGNRLHFDDLASHDIKVGLRYLLD